MDATDTYPESHRVTAQRAREIRTARGARARNIPAAVATPLPPRNRTYGENMWPSTAASPSATVNHAGPLDQGPSIATYGALDHVDHADGNRVLPAEHAVHVGGAEVVRAVLAQVDAFPEPAGDVARRRGADQVGEEEHHGQPEVVHPRAVSRLRRSFRLSGEPVSRTASRNPFTG